MRTQCHRNVCIPTLMDVGPTSNLGNYHPSHRWMCPSWHKHWHGTSTCSIIQALHPRDKLEPPTRSHRGILKPCESDIDAHGHVISYCLAPISASQTHDTTISVTVDTSIVVGTDTHWSPSDRRNTNILRSPKVHSTTSRGSPLLPNNGIQCTTTLLYH